MSAADILKDHQQHYLTRLLARNPLLKLFPSLYREDMTIILGQETSNTEKQVLPLDALKILISEEPKAVKIPNILKKNLAKCNKIKNESDDHFHSTGQLSFYLGFPFVYAPLESELFQFSPLFLWAITCKITNDSVIFSRATDEDGVPLEPQFNSILKAWLAYEENLHLSWDNSENLTFDTIIEETKLALSAWKKCDSKFDASNIVAIPSQDVLKTEQKNALVIPCAILGHIKFNAVGEDLVTLGEKLENEEVETGTLDYFLKPVQPTTIQENAPKPKDNEKWLVADYDNSQESVVWNTRKFDLMVLQGPPGTGKSQVIVNLIADAVANKKKVLVVCQKKAALEIIQKRLNANGLGELVQLIEDPQNDRMRIIKSVRAITNNFSHSPVFIANERDKISNLLNECEITLDQTNALLSENKNGQHPTYGNLKARLYQLAKEGIDAYGKLNLLHQKTMQSSEWLPDTQKELQALLQETGELLQQYKSCNYAENPYRNLESPENLAELRGIINQVKGLAKTLENSDSDSYAPQNAWLAEHDWAIPSYESFLSHENKQPYENFRYLVRDTQKLNKWFPKHYTDSLLAAVRNDKKITEYSRLKELSG